MAVMSRRGGGFAGCPPCTVSEIPLLQELAAQYPEVSGPGVAHALDRATVAAAALGGGEATPARIAALARDRLDVQRERALAAARRAGRPLPHRDETLSAEEWSQRSQRERPGGGGGGDSVPCTYCRTPIPAGDFAYCSAARQLLSATCPGCERQMALLAATWRRWLNGPYSPWPPGKSRYPGDQPYALHTAARLSSTPPPPCGSN